MSYVWTTHLEKNGEGFQVWLFIIRLDIFQSQSHVIVILAKFCLQCIQASKPTNIFYCKVSCELKVVCDWSKMLSFYHGSYEKKLYENNVDFLSDRWIIFTQHFDVYKLSSTLKTRTWQLARLVQKLRRSLFLFNFLQKIIKSSCKPIPRGENLLKPAADMILHINLL